MAVLRSEGGALDLASVMVGVLVIGIVGGVIAATVFAVIPWSQDRAARGGLDAVKTSESVQYGQSAGNGVGKFLIDTDLSGTTNATGAVLMQASPRIKVAVSANGQHYVGASASETGTVFYISENGQAPATVAPVTGTGDAATVAPVWDNVAKSWS